MTKPNKTKSGKINKDVPTSEKIAKLIWKEARVYRDRELDFVLKWSEVRAEEKQDYIKIAKKVIKANDKKWRGKIEALYYKQQEILEKLNKLLEDL